MDVLDDKIRMCAIEEIKQLQQTTQDEASHLLSIYHFLDMIFEYFQSDVQTSICNKCNSEDQFASRWNLQI